jgi:hypothetical protein
MKWSAAILVLLGIALTISVDARSRGKPRSRDGSYSISIAGYFKGEGSGTVSGNQMGLQLNVVTADGEKGALVAPSITLNGAHFTGSGTFRGKSVTLTGRVDAPDSDFEKAIKGVRLVSLVKTSDGRYAHLVGFIPALAAAPDNNPGNSGNGNGNNGNGNGNGGGKG